MSTKTRQNWIVRLRAYACMAVIMIHIISGWNVGSGIRSDTRDFLDNIILQPLIRWAVAVFIMITGCLLLDPEKDISLEKIKLYIKRILSVLLTFGFVYCIIENIFNYGTGSILKILYMSFFNLLQGKSWDHMWYLYLLIGLYALTPVLRAFLKQASIEEIKFTFYFLLIFSVIIPEINSLPAITATTFYVQNFNYVFLYISGYILYNKKIISDRVIYISGLIGTAGYILLSVTGFYCCNQEGICITFISMAVFTFFLNKRNDDHIPGIIEVISDDSFGIYLTHAFWINVFNKGLNIYPDILPIAIGELLFFIITLILSVLSVEIIKRIPYIKNIV